MSSNVTRKVVIAHFNRILNDLAKHVCTTLGLPVPAPGTGLPQRDERRPDLRNTPSSHQGPTAAILASSSSQSSIPQAAIFATTLKANGAAQRTSASS